MTTKKQRTSLVGMLGGAALILAIGPASARAAGLSNSNWGAAEAPSVSNTNSSAPKFTKLQAVGGGTGTFFGDEDCNTAESITALTCPSGHICHCVHVSGPISGNGIGSGTFTLDMDFDLTTAELGSVTVTNGVGSGLCLPGSGIGAITGTSSSVVVSFVGGECDNTALGLGDILTGYGTLVFQGGTGKFATAAGTSSVSFSLPFGTGVASQYSIQGEFSK